MEATPTRGDRKLMPRHRLQNQRSSNNKLPLKGKKNQVKKTRRTKACKDDQDPSSPPFCLPPSHAFLLTPKGNGSAANIELDTQSQDIPVFTIVMFTTISCRLFLPGKERVEEVEGGARGKDELVEWEEEKTKKICLKIQPVRKPSSGQVAVTFLDSSEESIE